MSDAAIKVDPEYYNRRLLETEEANGGQTGRGAGAHGLRPPSPGGARLSQSLSWGAGGGGGGGSAGRGDPEFPDYLVRQHTLLGFYLSLNPGDEADAERRWGFPYQQRAAIAGVTVVVPLVLAIFLTGSWLWKACVIAVLTVGARLAVSFVLATFSDVEVAVQGHVFTVWPQVTLGALAVLTLLWFLIAAVSGTGWSTLWLCFTSLLLLAGAEAALRAIMLHLKWWMPAERFSFLTPWGDSPAAVGGSGSGEVGRGGAYAPPRPSFAPVPRQDYGGVGSGDGGGGGNSGGGGDGVQLGNMGTRDNAVALDAGMQQNDEHDGLLEETGKEIEEGLEEILTSESA